MSSKLSFEELKTHLWHAADILDEKGGIWISGDNALIFKGLLPFDHSVEYGDFPRSWAGDKKHGELRVHTMYVNGIHSEIYSWLEERGWYPEWYDDGTLLLWKSDHEKTE